MSCRWTNKVEWVRKYSALPAPVVFDAPAVACEPIPGQDYAAVPTDWVWEAPMWVIEQRGITLKDGPQLLVHRAGCRADGRRRTRVYWAQARTCLPEPLVAPADGGCVAVCAWGWSVRVSLPRCGGALRCGGLLACHGGAVDLWDRESTPESDVGETALWTLHHRSLAARDPCCELTDPLAVELAQTLGRPLARRFGADNPGWARAVAVRARCYDHQTRAFLARHPRGTVVSLGEGLDTQFWRVDNGTMRWLGVDLADSAALRRRLLPDTGRRRTWTGSLLDPAWTREIDPSHGVLILAQGVLMYLDWDRVRAFVQACAARLPEADLVFDAPPAWFAAGTERGRWRYPAGYRPPPMRWGMTPARLRELRACPGVAAALPVRPPRGTGTWWGHVMPLVDRAPVLRAYRPLWVTRLQFAPAPALPPTADNTCKDTH